MINAKEFYKWLEENKIRKSSQSVQDLDEFLALHQSLKEDYVISKIRNLLMQVEDIAAAKYIGTSV